MTVKNTSIWLLKIQPYLLPREVVDGCPIPGSVQESDPSHLGIAGFGQTFHIATLSFPQFYGILAFRSNAATCGKRWKAEQVLGYCLPIFSRS